MERSTQLARMGAHHPRAFTPIELGLPQQREQHPAAERAARRPDDAAVVRVEPEPGDVLLGGVGLGRDDRSSEPPRFSANEPERRAVVDPRVTKRRLPTSTSGAQHLGRRAPCECTGSAGEPSMNSEFELAAWGEFPPRRFGGALALGRSLARRGRRIGREGALGLPDRRLRLAGGGAHDGCWQRDRWRGSGSGDRASRWPLRGLRLPGCAECSDAERRYQAQRDERVEPALRAAAPSPVDELLPRRRAARSRFLQRTPQALDGLRGALRPLRRVFLEHCRDGCVEGSRQMVRDLGDARGDLDEMLHEHARVALAREWMLPGEELERQDTQRVDVARASQRFTRALLGGHVARCSDQDAGIRQLGRSIQELGDAEVEQLRLERPVDIARQEDVRGFEITVQDAGRVSRLEPGRDLAQNGDDAFDRKQALDEQLGQCLAAQELHDDVWRSVLELTKAEDIGDVRMLQPAHGACFLDKSAHELRILRVGLGQDFDGHLFANQRVHGTVDGAERALADPIGNLVAAHSRSGRQDQVEWHRRSFRDPREKCVERVDIIRIGVVGRGTVRWGTLRREQVALVAAGIEGHTSLSAGQENTRADTAQAANHKTAACPLLGATWQIRFIWYSDNYMRLCEAAAKESPMSLCSIRVSRLRKFALSCCALCFPIVACDDLSTIRAGECGNRVIDEGEQCDDFPSDDCYGPDSPHACLIDCSQGASCPDGAGCGLDGVCRAASGQTTPVVFRSDQSDAPLTNGDFDGDGRKDLLVLDVDKALLSFDAQRQLGGLSASGLAFGTMLVSRIDGDQRDDLVTYDSAQLSLMRGSASGLVPLPRMLATPPAQGQRILPLDVDVDGDFALDPLLLADRDLLRIPQFGEDFWSLGTLEVAAGDIAGQIRRLALAQSPGCSGFVLAQRGAPSVHIYGICAAPLATSSTLEPTSARLLSTVALPASKLVGPSGALVGDVDGDGVDDLLIAASGTAGFDAVSEPVYVAYGLGNGSFQSRPQGTAEASPDATASEELAIAGGQLLEAAHLDGDAFVDLITARDIVLDPGNTAVCAPKEEDLYPCSLYHGEQWVSAVAADFTRDGNIDVIGVPPAARSLTLLLGAGSGVFNRHVIRAGSQVDAQQLPEGRPTVLAVGDYDGDLTTDLAFTMLDPAEASSGRMLAILYGKALSIPSEIQTVGSVGDMQELVTTSVLRGNGGGISTGTRDLLFRTRIGERDAVGFLAGETAFGAGSAGSSTAGGGDLTRILTSPLLFPNLGSDANDPTFIAALTLGTFTGRAERRDAVALAITQAFDVQPSAEPGTDAFYANYEAGTSLDLAFIENGDAGLAIVDPKQSAFEFPVELARGIKKRWFDPSLEGPGPLMQALDLDADGVDELVLCNTQVVQSQLVYWVIRRQGSAWSSEQHSVEVRAAGDLALRVAEWGQEDFPYRLVPPEDIDLDGTSDIVARGDGDAGTFVVVLQSGGSGTLAGGTALALDPRARAAAFANVDADRALELVAGGERGVQFFDVDLPGAQLDELAFGIPSGPVSALSVGDFDGDGISDIAASGEVVTVYFGEPEVR
jgi:hypothetical protein